VVGKQEEKHHLDRCWFVEELSQRQIDFGFVAGVVGFEPLQFFVVLRVVVESILEDCKELVLVATVVGVGVVVDDEEQLHSKFEGEIEE